jgi:YfiH family protein
MPQPASLYKFHIAFRGVNSSVTPSSQNFLNASEGFLDCFVNQSHSDQIVVVQNKSYVTQAGDALFCTLPGFRLWIKTADCLPIALWDEVSGEYAMVHAGWRGVTNQITLKTLSYFSNPNRVKCYIGPHIQWDSFEVSKEVAAEILASIKDSPDFSDIQNQLIKAHPTNPSKVLVNLSKVILTQLKSASMLPENIWISPHDTFTDPSYYSYRRDRTEKRNLSSISRQNA